MPRKVQYMADYSLGSVALNTGDIYGALYHFTKAQPIAPQEMQQRMAAMLMEQLKALRSVAKEPGMTEYGVLWRTAGLGAVLGLSLDEVLSCL